MWPGRHALAQTTGLNGFNQQLFYPTITHSGLYGVEGSATLPKRAWTLGLDMNFAKNVTSVTTPATGRITEIIGSQTAADLHGGVGLFSFMDVGIDMPLVAYQTGTNFNTLQSYRTASAGDLRFDIKFRLLDGERAPIGLGFLSRATAPTGDRSKFTGDDGPTWEGRLLVDKRFGPISLFANVGYRFVKAVTVLATTQDDLLTFGAGLDVPIPAGDRSWSLIAEAVGQSVINSPSEISTPVEIRGGIRKRLASGFVFNLGGGGRTTNAYGAPAFRLFAGLAFDSAVRDAARRRRIVVEAPIREVFYFDFGRATLRSADYRRLDAIGQQLISRPSVRVAVEGHADSTGPRTYNRRLSERRARQVMQYLVTIGVRQEQLRIEAYGETLPAAPNATAEGRRRNRRVEIEGESRRETRD